MAVIVVASIVGLCAVLTPPVLRGAIPSPQPALELAHAPAGLEAQQSLVYAQGALARSAAFSGRQVARQWFALSNATRQLHAALAAGDEHAAAVAQRDVDDMWPHLAVPSPAPAPASVGQDAAVVAALHAHLEDVGAGWVQVKLTDGDPCGQGRAVNAGAVQGCARSDDPGAIWVQRLSVDRARGPGARYVTVHEYAHLLQYRAGAAHVAAVADDVFGAGDGLEEAADCMAAALLGDAQLGAYTDDCTAGRGRLAAQLLTGSVTEAG